MIAVVSSINDCINAVAFVCLSIGAICPLQNKIMSHRCLSIAAFLSDDIKCDCKGKGSVGFSFPAISLINRLVMPRPGRPVKARVREVYLDASENSIFR